jgi:hypothetical protein
LWSRTAILAVSAPSHLPGTVTELCASARVDPAAAADQWSLPARWCKFLESQEYVDLQCSHRLLAEICVSTADQGNPASPPLSSVTALVLAACQVASLPLREAHQGELRMGGPRMRVCGLAGLLSQGWVSVSGMQDELLDYGNSKDSWSQS